jgi:2'-5' RNA ligase
VSTQRLFVAIALPAPVRDALVALASPLAGVNWTNPEQLHLTLRFLGDVPEEKIESVTTHLASVRVEPFVLPVEGVGAFPPKASPRVLWIGVGRGHPRLHQLRQRVDDALLAAGLLDLDVRTFHPHVTLARCGEGAASAITHWMHYHENFTAPPFRVTAFDLYASELRPAGAIHTLVRRFALAKEP